MPVGVNGFCVHHRQYTVQSKEFQNDKTKAQKANKEKKNTSARNDMIGTFVPVWFIDFLVVLHLYNWYIFHTVVSCHIVARINNSTDWHSV